MNELPLWKLPMYPEFDSPEYLNHSRELSDTAAALLELMDRDDRWASDPVAMIERIIPLLNRSRDLYENLETYTYCRFSVKTDYHRAMNELNRLEEEALPLKQVSVLFRNRLAASGITKETWEQSAILKDYTFFLEESLEEQKYQMSPAEEDLAADLSRPGGSAWGRLQETISSTLKIEWEPGEWKTVTQLRLMGSDPDRAVRKKAWEKELKCWESAEIPLAAALNGVKGFSHTINTRRGYKSTLERSVRQARMAPESLEAMIECMTDSLPDFRRYMKAKAARMGLERLSWYDVIAPMTAESKQWGWEESRDFIIKHFGALSPEYADFARKAYDDSWIDAPPRQGKVGGAYCISLPLDQESRILTNFAGSFTDVSTLAHELGHGWHHEVLKKAPGLHRDYPMTLAETASIFSETLVFQAYYSQAAESEKAGLLESSLCDSNQVITDILSRFLFEKNLTERRGSSEMSAEELKEMMLRSQDETYGDALHLTERHPWMWAVKGHYYNQDLGFYNFPYAFGLLFGWGLYSLYEEMGDRFEPLYRQVLQMTGRASAEDCAAAAGLDIRKKEFWQRSLDMIRRQIDDFCNMS